MKKLLFVALFAIFLVACAETNTTQEPIRVGLIGPMTGDIAFLGANQRLGAEIALEEINNAGGINGRPVELIIEDGTCSSKDAASAAVKLANLDGVDYVLGGLCSGETMGAAPILEAAQVATISPCSSAPAVTKAGDYIFRVYPSDLFQGKFSAQYARAQGFEKAAIMHCQNDWCEGLHQTFKQEFEALGGEVVAEQAFVQGTTDLRGHLTKIKTTNPDLIYFPSYTDSAIAGIEQMRELNIDIQVIGGDAWSDVTIWETAGSAGEGFIYTAAADQTSSSFKQKVEARGGENSICAPQSYDIMYLFSKAIAEVGDDPTAVKDYLYTIQNYMGASGTISFDENGDVTDAAYDVMVVEDGKAVVQ